MRTCRAFLVAMLVAALADLPVATAANRALGFILAAQSSQIDGIAAANGSNVFAGDALSTNSDGRIQLRFGANQIYLLPSSAIALANEKDGLMAVLSAGAVEFASPRGTQISVRAEDVIVRPKTPAPTHAQVTILSNNELRVASVTGPLELELDGELYTLTPGRTYGVKIVDDNAKDQYTEYRPARRRRKLIVVLFAGAAAAAAIIYLVQELHESPDVP